MRMFGGSGRTGSSNTFPRPPGGGGPAAVASSIAANAANAAGAAVGHRGSAAGNDVGASRGASVSAVEGRIQTCRSHMAQINEMLKMPFSPDLCPMVDMLIDEGQEEVDKMQSFGDSCFHEGRVDLVEQICTVAGEFDDTRQRAEAWKHRGSTGPGSGVVSVSGPISEDERMARELQSQFEEEERVASNPVTPVASMRQEVHAAAAASPEVRGSPRMTGGVERVVDLSHENSSSGTARSRRRREKDREKEKKEKEEWPMHADGFGDDRLSASDNGGFGNAWPTAADFSSSGGGCPPASDFGAFGNTSSHAGFPEDGRATGASFFGGGSGFQTDGKLDASPPFSAAEAGFTGDGGKQLSASAFGGGIDAPDTGAAGLGAVATASADPAPWPPHSPTQSPALGSATKAPAPAASGTSGAGNAQGGGAWASASGNVQFPEDGRSVPASPSVQGLQKLGSTTLSAHSSMEPAVMHIRCPFPDIADDVEGFTAKFVSSIANAAGIPEHRIRVRAVLPG